MAITAADVINKLKVLFPNGIIYEEQYLKRTGALSFEVHKQAKASQMTRVQWLASNGFAWKDTGYVEPDLCYRDAAKSTGDLDAFAIANYVFTRYPLAGEYVPTFAEDQLLYQSAKQTVQKVLKSDTRITARENVVLVLETIELLKTWSSDVLSEETGNTFWSYVFQQYGFNAENSDAASDRLYVHFRKAIKDTLTHYKRRGSSSASRIAVVKLPSSPHIWSVLIRNSSGAGAFGTRLRSLGRPVAVLSVLLNL